MALGFVLCAFVLEHLKLVMLRIDANSLEPGIGLHYLRLL